MTTEAHKRLNQTLDSDNAPRLVPILKRFEHLDILDYYNVAKALIEAQSAACDHFAKKLDRAVGK